MLAMKGAAIAPTWLLNSSFPLDFIDCHSSGIHIVSDGCNKRPSWLLEPDGTLGNPLSSSPIDCETTLLI